MYLSGLSNEQKELFLDLAIFSMASDGVIEEREKSVAQQYCNEMQIEFRTTTNFSSYVDVIKKLKEISSESDLKKVTFEFVALMYTDDNFADEEEKLLRCIQEYFGFSSHLMGELVFVSRHTLLSYRMIENVVKN